MNMYMGNGILEINRIESGQTKLDEAVCNLEDIIKNRYYHPGSGAGNTCKHYIY